MGGRSSAAWQPAHISANRAPRAIRSGVITTEIVETGLSYRRFNFQ